MDNKTDCPTAGCKERNLQNKMKKNCLVERHEAVRKVLCSENQGQGFRKKPELWDGREMSIGKNS